MLFVYYIHITLYRNLDNNNIKEIPNEMFYLQNLKNL